MRYLMKILMFIVMICWTYRTFSNSPIVHELISRESFSFTDLLVILIISALIVTGIIVNNYGLIFPLLIAMAYEVVACIVRIAVVVLLSYTEDWELSDKVIATISEAFFIGLRSDPLSTIAREACALVLCCFSMVVTVFQITENMQTKRERQETHIEHLPHQIVEQDRVTTDSRSDDVEVIHAQITRPSQSSSIRSRSAPDLRIIETASDTDTEHEDLKTRKLCNPLIAIINFVKNLPINERVEILEMLHDIYTESLPEEMQVAFARTCMQFVTAFSERNARLVGISTPKDRYAPLYKKYSEEGQWEDAELHWCFFLLTYVLWEVPVSIISEIGRSHAIMSAIFYAIGRESPLEDRDEDRESSAAAFVLSRILCQCSDEDRVYLKDRYTPELKMALMKMWSSDLRDAMESSDIAAIIATDRTTLEVLKDRIYSSEDYTDDRFTESWSVAALLLKYGLETSSSELERMLAQGLLIPAAHHFASQHNTADQTEAAIFTNVLNERPEWKQSFREATLCDGISYTASLGRSIPVRISKKADYFFN